MLLSRTTYTTIKRELILYLQKALKEMYAHMQGHKKTDVLN